MDLRCRRRIGGAGGKEYDGSTGDRMAGGIEELAGELGFGSDGNAQGGVGVVEVKDAVKNFLRP